jgi:hypothetical protein
LTRINDIQGQRKDTLFKFLSVLPIVEYAVISLYFWNATKT